MSKKKNEAKSRERSILGGRYRLSTNLSKADKFGNPALWAAQDNTSFLHVKEWPRLSAEDEEIKTIWTHEVRSLLRLGGYPRANEYFAQIREAAFDERSYYLILETGTRTLLSPLLEKRRRQPWLSNLTTLASRQSIWRGLKRIATGLTILHTSGILHRTLRPEAIFVDEEGNADFRLSGFEWSLRLASTIGPKARSHLGSKRLRAPELTHTNAQFSFATDWFDFGLLAAEILGAIEVNRRGHAGHSGVLEDIRLHTNFSQREKEFLSNLLATAPSDRLREGTSVIQVIDDILNAARQRLAVRQDRVLYIGVHLGATSRLTRAIVDVSAGKIGRSDLVEQRRFIESDLTGEVEVVYRPTPTPHYIAHGRKLAYRINRWTSPSTWDVGFCGMPDTSPSRLSDVRYNSRERSIRVLHSYDVSPGLPRIRTTSLSWEATFPAFSHDDLLDKEQSRVHDFFSVTNQLDALLTAAQIWPVKVVSSDIARTGRVELEVTPVLDPARSQLAHFLDIKRPDVQMYEVFVHDQTQGERASEAEYVLEDEGLLGRRDQESSIGWRYDSHTKHPDGIRYTFSHEDESGYCPTGQLYLSPKGLSGSTVLLRRRQRAIEAMQKHATLLSAIADPATSKRDTHETLKDGDALAGLDDSKQLALHEIWRSLPLYTLQGPPGTGKTELIKTMVSQLLETSPTEQILITAHSNDAVDHIRDVIVDTVSDIKGPLGPSILVRLDADGDGAVAETALGIAEDVHNSILAKSCPAKIKQRLQALASPEGVGSNDGRTFQGLVRNAANVVFATSNSGELASMLESERRFDWSFIEEAGKAHGFDLAAALQASHRLLLIGDQRQLPPFNDKKLDALLADPARVLNALRSGFEFAPAFIDRSFRDADASDAEFVADCERWREMIRFFGALYDSCYSASKDGRKIARRLEEQHRMHPVISDLIAECFYCGGLTTADVAKQKFINVPDKFQVQQGSWLADKRIVFVDTQWVQMSKEALGEIGGKDGNRRYTSPDEVRAVIKILGELQASGDDPPSIQILSPYKAQVEAIREAVLERLGNGHLSQLSRFKFVGDRGAKIGATVDEFQGNEADVIIASLVRNNAHPAGSGVGFLADEPRVNVLLSRAKRKLILVGSWDFFDSRVPKTELDNTTHPLAHIARVMTYLKTAISAGQAARISLPSAS